MMSVQCLGTVGCLALLLSVGWANEEQAGQQKCQQYGQYVRSHTAYGVTLTLACQNNTHRAAQWQCIIDQQGDHHRVNADAIPLCLKPAPMLGDFEANSAIKHQSPAIFCQAAMIAFESHDPNNPHLEKIARQCAHPVKSMMRLCGPVCCM